MKTAPITETQQQLDYIQTQQGIKLIKDVFQQKLADQLSLTRVTAPRFLITGTGLQDDLAGTQVPVSFQTRFADKIEMVHSLAKWKRHMLGKHSFKPGTGIYTDMDAIRKDEKVSDIHSVYVDQWDWEQVITGEQRTLEFLKHTVRKIYRALQETEAQLCKGFPLLKPRLPPSIHFITTQELEDRYPQLTPGEREDKACEEHGAIFLIGIGAPLASGKKHDLRAADYDDWQLDGDIIVYDWTRKKALELSSMGIRVDKESLLKQLRAMGQDDRARLPFHQSILEEKLPLSIGGGIGQSRLCMLLLQKQHIGEVQVSEWPEAMRKACDGKGVALL